MVAGNLQLRASTDMAGGFIADREGEPVAVGFVRQRDHEARTPHRLHARVGKACGDCVRANPSGVARQPIAAVLSSRRCRELMRLQQFDWRWRHFGDDPAVSADAATLVAREWALCSRDVRHGSGHISSWRGSLALRPDPSCPTPRRQVEGHAVRFGSMKSFDKAAKRKCSTRALRQRLVDASVALAAARHARGRRSQCPGHRTERLSVTGR
jgi:hypothetical protein